MNFGKPKFKSKHNKNDSIFYPQNFKIKKSRIFVAKIGWIPFIKHREILGKPLNITITQNGNEWYVTISCELKIKDKPLPNINDANIVGIDLGTKTFAVLSDKTEIENPRTLKKNLSKLKREQKRLSRKKFVEKEINGKTVKTSSNNRIKQKEKARKIHNKVKNIRNNFLHNLTHQMITKYDGFAIETLDIKGMLKDGNKNLNRSINDVSWYEFGRQLEYKSKWNFKYFTKIDKYSPTTKKCSQCGNITDMELDDRTYDCQKCGNHINRDYNASLNILSEGLNILKENTLATKGIYACGVLSVERTKKQEKLRIDSVAA